MSCKTHIQLFQERRRVKIQGFSDGLCIRRTTTRNSESQQDSALLTVFILFLLLLLITRNHESYWSWFLPNGHKQSSSGVNKTRVILAPVYSSSRASLMTWLFIHLKIQYIAHESANRARRSWSWSVYRSMVASRESRLWQALCWFRRRRRVSEHL